MDDEVALAYPNIDLRDIRIAQLEAECKHLQNRNGELKDDNMDAHDEIGNNKILIQELRDEIFRLINENKRIVELEDECKRLQIKNKELERHNQDAHNMIESNKILIQELRKEIVRLTNENIELRNEVNSLRNDVNEMKREKAESRAQYVLNECFALANEEFKAAYRREFKMRCHDTIWNYIDTPPLIEESPSECKFWETFRARYPIVDDPFFREIDQAINCGRNDEAHPQVSNMRPDEFDKYIKIVFPDRYGKEKSRFDALRDGLYTFPARKTK